MEDIQGMIDSTREKVKGYLGEIYDDFQEYDSGMFTFQEGSAVIGVTIRPWYENDIAVEFTSQLVSNAQINADVMRWLLEKNVELHFGALGLLFDDTIVYSHTLPGSDLQSNTFRATAKTVATIADHYDDEIVSMAGGQLASEAIQEITAEVS